MEQQNNLNKKDFKRLFNMNNIISQILSWAAYIVIVISIGVLVYLSFVETIDFNTDWRTLTLFTVAGISLSWLNWNTWYKRQYESVMSEDINQQAFNKYSIHSRYYMAIKDWSDVELQTAIDKFNNEYEAKWLRWVEKYTGFPIETREEVELDRNGKPIILESSVLLDEYGEEVLDIDFNPIIVDKYKTHIVTGIKDLPYKGFKHKLIMWRIKNHRYPQSGYKTSMELMSLFSFRETNIDRRDLRADKKFYTGNSIRKLLSLTLIITMGGSIVPTMVQGNWFEVIFKLLLVLGSLFTSILFGAMAGVRGARLKLSIVEDASQDLELWAQKKPVIAPYKEPKTEEQLTQIETNQLADNTIGFDIFERKH